MSWMLGTAMLADEAPLLEPVLKRAKGKGKGGADKHKDLAKFAQMLILKMVFQHDQWLRQVHSVIQYTLQVDSDKEVIKVMAGAGKRYSEECNDRARVTILDVLSHTPLLQ